MKLKRLSLFLALVMIISAFAGTFTFASAAEVETDPNGAWKVNDKTYATLKDAFNARGDATTIYLIKDYVQETAQVDLAFDGNLTIEGVSNGGKMPVYSTSATTRLIRVNEWMRNAGCLTIKNIEMVNEVNTGGIVQCNRGGLILDGVKVSAGNYAAGAIILCDGGIVCTIKDSTLTGFEGASVSTGTALVYLRSQTDLYVVNSTLDASANSMAIVGASTTTIMLKDSTLKGTETASYAVQTGGATYYQIGTVAISGAKATTDATTVLNAVTETAPTYATAAEADAAAAKAGYIVRNNADALVAMSDMNGDGLYWDGYSKVFYSESGYKSAINYLCADFSYDADVYHANLVVDGQNKYNINAIGKLWRASGVTIRNTKFTGNGAALIQAQGGATVTLDNVDCVFTGTSGYGVVIQDKATFNFINGSTFVYNNTNRTAYASGYGIFRFNDTKNSGTLTIKNSTLTASGFIYAITSTNASLNAKITIENSVISTSGGAYCTNSSSVKDGAAIHLGTNDSSTHVVTITGSTINSASDHAIYMEAKGTLTMKNTKVVMVKNGDTDATMSDTAIESSRPVVATMTNCIVDGSAVNKMGAAWFGGTGSTLTAEACTFVANANASKAVYASGSVTFKGDNTVLNGAVNSVASASMLNGASVRIAKGADAENLTESGIRFESTLSAAIIAEVNGLLDSGAIKNATVGTVVFKYEDLGNKTVAELVEAANADANDDLVVADIEAVNGVVMNEDGSANLRAAIINIKEKNYGVQFGAVAYIEMTYEDGSTVRIYGAFDSTNNVRSIKQVATSALGDYQMEAGVVEGYNYYNEITVVIEGVETTVYSCYSDKQIAILNAYAK